MLLYLGTSRSGQFQACFFSEFLVIAPISHVLRENKVWPGIFPLGMLSSSLVGCSVPGRIREAAATVSDADRPSPAVP